MLNKPEDIDGFVQWRLRAGVEPAELRKLLSNWQLDDERIRRAMGEAYSGRRASGEANYASLSAPPLVRRAIPGSDIVRIPVGKAQIFAWKNFLDETTCDAVIDLIDQDLRPSTTADALGDPLVRTSRTADIGQLDSDLVRSVDDGISNAMGIHWSYAEPTQGQRYDAGQEYRAHHDYFLPGSHDYQIYCQFMGQRTWTFMVYLNDVEDGGGTRFRRLDRIFKPERGKALIWNNLNADGSVNPYTLHQGMKVRSGSKYVITKWFRERGWGPMLLEPVQS